MVKKKTTVHHAHRYEQFDEAFLLHLGTHLPGFKALDFQERLALSGMINEAPSRYRAHSHFEGYSRFTWQELEEDFGRGGFNEINDRLKIFKVLTDEAGRPNWSKAERRTKPYMLTDEVAAIRDQFFANCYRRRPAKLLTQDGKYLLSPPVSAMVSRNKDGQARRGFKDLPVKTLVPVHIDLIKKLMVDIQARLIARQAGEGKMIQAELMSEVPSIKFLKALQQDAAMLLRKAKNQSWPGKVLHRYEEKESGRYYVDGPGNLQNCYRVLREAAMSGLYDLDIENCHYSILAQMAEASGYQCVKVLDYLNNKDSVRAGLAQRFNISTKQAKDALIALIYGAKFSSRPEDALPKIFNSAKLAALVYQDETFKALRADIAGARKAVLAAQPVSRRTIKNCRDLTIRLDGSNDRQQLAHLLQGVESAALEAAYRLHPEQIVLLQHDGFTSTESLDTRLIEQAMQDATGYQYKVKETRIQINLEDAYNAHPDLNKQNAEMAFPQ